MTKVRGLDTMAQQQKNSCIFCSRGRRNRHFKTSNAGDENGSVQSRSQPRSQDLSSYRLLEQALGKRLAAVLEVIVLGKALILMFA